MKAQEYAMLGQSEGVVRDHDGYIVRPKKDGKKSVWFRIFCVFLVIVFICGAIALVAGLFYPEKVNSFIDNYIKKDDLIDGNATEIDMREVFFGNNNVTNIEFDHSAHVRVPAIHVHQHNETSLGESGMEEDESDGNDSEKAKLTPKSDDTKMKEKPLGNNNTKDVDDDVSGLLNQDSLDDAQKQLASIMIRVETFLENITGIHKPEIIIPLFMLSCFLVSTALSACCCCMMMKRKETQRRKALGKMITDLETGDSNELLDQDGDD